MKSSTPLSQLPNNNQPFVSDQQRQYITKAQNAISNSPMPQNTQLSNDIINDDDAVVQDILNQINTPSNEESFQQNDQLQQQQLAMQQQMMHQQAMQQQMMQQQAMQQVVVQPQPKTFEIKNLFSYFKNDLTLAGIVFCVFIIIYLTPVDKIISRYIKLDNIPYHDVIIRAIIATLLIIIIKKLID